jgi:hypothetical protein
VKGRFRDKENLIRVAKAEAKKAFGVLGKIRVVDLESYRDNLNGQVVVVEFGGREYNAPGGGSKSLRG